MLSVKLLFRSSSSCWCCNHFHCFFRRLLGHFFCNWCRYFFYWASNNNWFFSNYVALRTNARLYTDTWGINAVTVGAEVPIKITPTFSLSPFYRFHAQSKAKYFAGYGQHELSQEFYTSDFDLSNFYANKFGGTLRLTPFWKLGQKKDKSNVLAIKSIDLRYAKYLRSDGLDAQTFTLDLNVEF